MSQHSSEDEATEAGRPDAEGAASSPAVPEPPEREPGPQSVEEPQDERPAPGRGEASEEGQGPADAGAETTDWEAVAEEDPRSKAALLAELDAVEEARDDYLDALQRARAEFDNYRKRMMREGTAQRERGKAEVAEALLDVLDDFDRTLQAADTGENAEDESLVRGVELVYGKLVDALKAVGLARIGEAGVVFDPNRHEAVQKREAEDGDTGGQQVVAEVLRPGYEMAGRVIRAAMVVVEQ